MILADLGSAANLYGVTRLSGYLRSVVNPKHIMDARSDEDVQSLVGFGEDLVERRRRNLVVSREPSFFLPWIGKQLEMPTRGVFSRVMGVATPSRPAFPPAEALLERETALPVSAQSTLPSALVFYVDGFSWVIDEPFRDILGRAVLFTEDDVFLENVCVHSRSGESALRMLQTMKLFPGTNVGFVCTSCSVTGQVCLNTTGYTPLLEIPI